MITPDERLAHILPVTFREEGHGYTYQGRPVRWSLTQMIRVAFDGLPPAGSVPAEPTAAMIRGKYAHEALHLLTTDDLDWDHLDMDLVGYVGAGEQFLNKSVGDILLSERPLVHPELDLATTPDLLCHLRESPADVDLVEWKTGTVNVASTRIQLAGQEAVLRRNGVIRPEESCARWAVELHADGTKELFPFRDPSDGASFTASWQWANYRASTKA